MNPYSVKSNLRLDNSGCFSEFLNQFFVIYVDLNTGYHHAAYANFTEFLGFPWSCPV